MDELTVILRDYQSVCDEAYIYASWRNAAYYSAYKRPEGNAKTFFHKQSRKIKEILETSNVKIACLEESPNVIIGYSVSTGDHLNFIYVKHDYRLKGIGALLMPKDIKTVTSELTKAGKAIVEKKNLKTQGEYNGFSTRIEDRQENQRI